jgi:hypothetical protein
MRAPLFMALLIAALVLLPSGPAVAEDDPWQGTDLYKRTLVPPDRPDARGTRPLYPWRDGSMHTITEPPPPRPKFDPTQNTAPGHAERSAPHSRQDDNSWQSELEQNKSDPRFCATHTRTASALDKCTRAQESQR